ncbi:MAG TPA: lysylphosphatidylglycerol synthase transmembrane domain-containing protein [Gaiellaceae bacterium]|nr:lysylphosphatidylglycerol synthase transmembrane domain-containing protein [Gaiellaceae bacterium]
MLLGSRRFLSIGLPLAIALATVGAFVVVAHRTGTTVLHAATTPNWFLLGAAFAISAGVQPLRAWAWSSTLRSAVGFRAVYTASAVGSFLDTVLPGRLGEGSKVAVLKISAGKEWPGLPRAGGSLLCAHLVEMIAFALVGAVSAFFLPLPGWARWTVVLGLGAASAGLALAGVLHRRLGRRLPRFVDGFLAGAAAPLRTLALALAILLATWIARGAGVYLLLHALHLDVSVRAALLYMLVTGLANTAPLLPGNAGIYQGAALGALALVHKAGAHAVAASLLAPVVVSVAAGTAALVGLALYGRRVVELSRAALQFGA